MHSSFSDWMPCVTTSLVTHSTHSYTRFFAVACRLLLTAHCGAAGGGGGGDGNMPSYHQSSEFRMNSFFLRFALSELLWMGNVLSGRSAWCRKRGEKWKVFVFSFLFEAELFVFTANELAWHRIGEKFAALLFKFVIGVEVELSHKFLTYHALAFSSTPKLW